MTQSEIYNDKLKYYLDSSHMVRMNGEPDKYTNLMHMFNTFLSYFWRDYFGGGFWAQDIFLQSDIREVHLRFIELANKPEDEMTIGMLKFIDEIKPTPLHYPSEYPKPMTCYEGEFAYSPRQIFLKMKELLKIDSVQDAARESFRKDGIPYTSINVI